MTLLDTLGQRAVWNSTRRWYLVAEDLTGSCCGLAGAAIRPRIGATQLLAGAISISTMLSSWFAEARPAPTPFPHRQPDRAERPVRHPGREHARHDDDPGHGEPPARGRAVGPERPEPRIDLRGRDPLDVPPTADFHGTDEIVVEAQDAFGAQYGQASATLAITVPPVEGGQRAVDDSRITAAGTAITTEKSALLANDSDPERAPLSFVSVQNTDHGSAVIEGAAVVFTPETDFVGTASFMYTISNGRLTATATVHVLCIQPPIAVDDAIFVENTSVGGAAEFAIDVFELLHNDSDPEGHSLRIRVGQRVCLRRCGRPDPGRLTCAWTCTSGRYGQCTASGSGRIKETVRMNTAAAARGQRSRRDAGRQPRTVPRRAVALISAQCAQYRPAAARPQMSCLPSPSRSGYLMVAQ